MNRTRLTTIAHRDHLFCSPLGSERADALLARLALARGGRVLDVGCGKAELLLRLVERHAARAVGVDINPVFLDAARARAASRVGGGALTLLERPAVNLNEAPGSFDAALCIGSTHALGGYVETLRALQTLVRDSGRVLVGDGYWKRPPDDEYLAVLGGTREEFTGHEGNIANGAALGLNPLAAEVSSLEEWDAYEDLYADAVERYAREHPDDTDAPAMLDHVRRWHRAYRRWGRETLGFGFYLFAS